MDAGRCGLDLEGARPLFRRPACTDGAGLRGPGQLGTLRNDPISHSDLRRHSIGSRCRRRTDAGKLVIHAATDAVPRTTLSSVQFEYRA